MDTSKKRAYHEFMLDAEDEFNEFNTEQKNNKKRKRLMSIEELYELIEEEHHHQQHFEWMKLYNNFC